MVPIVRSTSLAGRVVDQRAGARSTAPPHRGRVRSHGRRPAQPKFDAELPRRSYHRVCPGESHEEVRMIVYSPLLSRFRGRAAEGFA